MNIRMSTAEAFMWGVFCGSLLCLMIFIAIVGYVTGT